MPDYSRVRGSASQLFRIFLKNSSVTTGAGLAGLTNASSGLVIGVMRELSASPTYYTVAGSTIQTIPVIGTFSAPAASSCRFAPVDNTNWVGEYEIQLADALFNASDASRFIKVIVYGAANLTPTEIIIELNSVDFQNGVNAAITALPNAVVGASGGLLAQGTGANQITTNGSGLVQANVSAYGASLDPASEVWGASLASWDSGGTMGFNMNLVSTIGTFGVIVVSPVNQAGNITLISGMSYLVANSNSIQFSSKQWGANLSGLTITLWDEVNSVVLATGSVIAFGGPGVLQTVNFDFSSANTTSLLSGSPYRFVARAALASSNFFPLASGLLTVTKQNF